MLLPTQQAATMIVTGLMQSVIEDIEKRGVEEEERLKGRKSDDVVQPKIKSDEAVSAANNRINEYFFGALARDENPMAVLMSRFVAATGLERDPTETDDAFATRLADVLTLTDLVTRTVGGKATRVTLATLKVSQDALRGALADPKAEVNAMTAYAARLATTNGLSATDDNLAVQMEVALTQARAGMPESIAGIEEKAGLRKLGITAADMVEAIRRPWGSQAQAIQQKLDDTAADEKTMTADMTKVIQRLKQVADQPTIEELQQERTEKDPTRVEDAQTRAEREEDIRALEAREKMEDIRDIQDATSTRDTGASEGTRGDEAAEPAIDAVATLTVLAAGAEAAKTEAASEAQADANADGSAALTGEAPVDETTGDAERPTAEQQKVMLMRAASAAEGAQNAQAEKEILAISIDENGIYALLERKEAA